MVGQRVVAFVDASFCRRTGASGWGMTVIKSPKATAIELGGAMESLEDSHEAEQMALVHGVAALVEEVGVIDKHVVVYTDTPPDDPYGLNTRLLARGALSARLEYQPGHRGAAGTYAGLHEQADRVAKSYMREQRNNQLSL